MLMNRWMVWVGSLSVGLGVLSHAELSAACSPPPPGPYVYPVTQDVPVGGVLVVRAMCDHECEGPVPPLRVVDGTTGEVVSGTEETIEGEGTSNQVRAWRPSTEWVEGRSYRVQVDAPEVRSVVEFDAVASSALDPAGLDVTAEVELREALRGEQTCCWPALGDCGTSRVCFSREVERSAVLRVNLTDSLALTQFTKHVTFTTSTGAVIGEVSSYLPELRQDYGAALDQYCYQIELQSLVDGTRHELPVQCVDHGEAGPTGVFPMSEEVLDQRLLSCDSPPEGYEERWCSSMRQACAEHTVVSACDDLEQLGCELTGEGGSGGADGETGGTGGTTSGTGGSTGGTTSGTGGSSDGGGDEDSDGGCSVSGVRSRSSGWGLAGLGLGLAVALRRMRRRS